MPKYIIEREIPGAGKLSAPELKAISQKSCSVSKLTETVVAVPFESGKAD